jgi:HK97 family phage major capsid protein
MENKKEALVARQEELMKQKAALQSNTKSEVTVKSALSGWGVKSFDELVGVASHKEDGLFGVNVADKRFAYLSAEKREAVKNLKEATDIAIMESVLFKRSVKETQAYNTMIIPIVEKAFGISSGSDGFEWIPTGVSTSYIDEFNLERKVSSLFQEIRMPTNPFKFPVLTNGAVARLLAPVSAVSPKQSFDTDSTITFDAVKLSSQYLLPEELSEDSAVAILQVIRQELVEGMEKSIEIAILNGDTTGPHMDAFSVLGTGAAPAADSPEKAWMGLRKRAFAAGAAAQHDAGGDRLISQDIVTVREKMGKFGVNPRDLALIAGPRGYNQLIDLDEVTTLEKYGQSATILSGELARVYGIPVIVSEYMREDLDATGVNILLADNKIAMLLVNRRRFMVGLRRALQIRVEKNKTDYDATDLVSYARYAFQGVLKADGSNYSSESSVAMIRNIGA